jgi:methionyl-tRNA formyltransferase
MQQAAESLGLSASSPDSVNLPESQSRLASLAPDLLVVCDYGEILRSETLATARLGGINLHGSLLPKYRGAAPVQWAILRGEVETGNSVIQMTPGLDAGPCLGQQRTPIDPDEDAATLESRLAVMGADLVVLSSNNFRRARHNPSCKTHPASSAAAHQRSGAVDWSRTDRNKNLVRAVRPWPRAYILACSVRHRCG